MFGARTEKHLLAQCLLLHHDLMWKNKLWWFATLCEFILMWGTACSQLRVCSLLKAPFPVIRASHPGESAQRPLAHNLHCPVFNNDKKSRTIPEPAHTNFTMRNKWLWHFNNRRNTLPADVWVPFSTVEIWKERNTDSSLHSTWILDLHFR